MIAIDAPRRQPAPPWAVHALISGLFSALGCTYQAELELGSLLTAVMTTPPAQRWPGRA